ncbi:MAG TPA: Maf family protein [Smithella sp.]|jgi:septum formation protein|nr:septum formation inhibitor Maf [Deltaproteobacteria bacterium]HNQ65750.1 Maf family protein [Smithella sp.]HOE31993.1 Maf family protein [Smithella sp.]HOO35773.1 Maf family protein [Smithella sp.]HPK21183.1 Maf family protein [Smithella sp.]
MSITAHASLILASASPRRQEMLRSAGVHVKIIPAHVNEKYLTGETPRQHVRRLSSLKAMKVAVENPDACVLGADTIVVIDGTVLGKPRNKTQAKTMLKKLSGRQHTVFTGFTVVRLSFGIRSTGVVQSVVRFKTIHPDEMEWYIAGDEPYDKAGGYALQGQGACFVRSIRGSYTNVIGLPLCEVLETLKKLHVIDFC